MTKIDFLMNNRHVETSIFWGNINLGDLVSCWEFHPSSGWEEDKLRYVGIVVQVEQVPRKFGTLRIHVLTEDGIKTTPQIKIDKIIRTCGKVENVTDIKAICRNDSQ